MKTLKLNSRGNEVKQLQQKLKITADGIFGQQTLHAVLNFQRQNNLQPDGIVGPLTWSLLLSSPRTGVSHTPNVSHTPIFDPMVGELVEPYLLPENAYFSKPTNKKWIFLHHTAGWQNPYRDIDSWAKRPDRKIATEFVIGGQSIHNDNTDHDGKILQAIPNNGWAWHLGIGNQRMHRESIGIELNSFGYLTKGYFEKRVNGKLQSIERDKNAYYTYVSQEVHRDQVITLEQPFRGYDHWHRYSSKQIKSLKLLLEHLANEHNIDIRKGLPDLIRKKGAKAFDIISIQLCINNPGIWSHTNVSHKTDVSPQPELMEMLLSL